MKSFLNLFLFLCKIEPRGFGFVTFESIESVYGVLAVTEHYIDGKLVECKHAVPKDSIMVLPLLFPPKITPVSTKGSIHSSISPATQMM